MYHRRVHLGWRQHVFGVVIDVVLGVSVVLEFVVVVVGVVGRKGCWVGGCWFRWCL
jgi:hypothetical protein